MEHSSIFIPEIYQVKKKKPIPIALPPDHQVSHPTSNSLFKKDKKIIPNVRKGSDLPKLEELMSDYLFQEESQIMS